MTPYLFAKSYAPLIGYWDEEMKLDDSNFSGENYQKPIQALKDSKTPAFIKEAFRNALWDHTKMATRTSSAAAKAETEGNLNRLLSQLKKEIWWF